LTVSAKRRQGYAPSGVGSLEAILLLIGKFVVNSELVVYLAIAVLLGASVWISWPSGKRKRYVLTLRVMS
jgi:hypothetical protein